LPALGVADASVTRVEETNETIMETTPKEVITE